VELLIMAESTPRCRVYLQVPASLTAKLESQLAQALALVAPACVLLCQNGEHLEKVPADRLIDLAQSAGVACLIENSIALAEELGADGVHILADREVYAKARAILGESANIGASCGFDRHEAMQLAEAGANYVAFGPDTGTIDAIDQYKDIIGWWSEIFVVPCIAWNVESAALAAELAEAGADFIAPPRSIWQHDAALEIIADIDKAIRAVRRAA
jgi:thiamine-phosphate pyrophosphorylase